MPNLVLAPYFTKPLGYSQHDSSNEGKGGSKPNDYNIIKDWYESVVKLGLEARIFHNELSTEFVSRHTTDRIGFVLWPEVNRPSYNDERFFAYVDYIMKLKNADLILCTDLFDVKFLMNPFELMNENADCQLFCGCEKITSYSGQWMRKKCKQMQYPTAVNDYDTGKSLFNAGIVGGKCEIILELFKSMTMEMKKLPQRWNSNMPVYNHCLEKKMIEKNWKIFSGYPLHNVFGSFKADTGTYIMHK